MFIVPRVYWGGASVGSGGIGGSVGFTGLAGLGM